MCGVAGIVGAVSTSNRDALERMERALLHRGPDAGAVWTSTADGSGWGCLLAHRRLSILDLAPTGAQPMVDPRSGDVIVTNGEIYNYVALRDELRRRGDEFRSTGDTEVMLKALSRDGAAALSSLRGMFACAFWTARSRRLTLARDPLGIKPLYVATNPDPSGEWSFVFASEVRALLASGLLGTPRLDRSAVSSFAWNGFVVGPNTAVAGISELAPGTALVVDQRGRTISAEPFWSRAADPHALGAGPSMHDALTESVALHLASDVPLGVFLSGGVDSAAVANLAQRASSSPIHTFTMTFDEADHNEGPLARRIAAGVGSEHHEVELSESRFAAGLDAAVSSLDQPTMDAVNSYFMSHAVREAGFTVALVGTGADELFGGYRSFLDLPRMLRWNRATRAVPRRLQAALARLGRGALSVPRRGGKGLGQQSSWAKLPEMLARGDDLVRLYQLAYALFLPGFHEELVAGSVAADAAGLGVVDGLPRATYERLTGLSHVRFSHGGTSLEAIGMLEQNLFLGSRLLRDTDAVSMSASLEVRLPFVDSVLLDAVERLDPAARFEPVGRKQVVRTVGLEGLDRAIFERPKTGFVLPFERWLRSDLGNTVGDTLRDPVLVAPTGLSPTAVDRLWTTFRDQPGRIYWSRIWALYAFVRWCHGNGVYV